VAGVDLSACKAAGRRRAPQPLCGARPGENV